LIFFREEVKFDGAQNDGGGDLVLEENEGRFLVCLNGSSPHEECVNGWTTQKSHEQTQVKLINHTAFKGARIAERLVELNRYRPDEEERELPGRVFKSYCFNCVFPCVKFQKF